MQTNGWRVRVGVFNLISTSAVFIVSFLQLLTGADPEWKKFNVSYCQAALLHMQLHGFNCGFKVY